MHSLTEKLDLKCSVTWLTGVSGFCQESSSTQRYLVSLNGECATKNMELLFHHDEKQMLLKSEILPSYIHPLVLFGYQIIKQQRIELT